MSHYGMFYNDKKQELMGTDGLFVCDGRLGRTSTIMEAKKQARMFDKNFPHKKITYVRLFAGRISSSPHWVSDLINLRD